MFITMPASKYTVFAPAVEQYKWFHASASCVSSLSCDFSPSSFLFSFFCIYYFLLLPAVLLVWIFHTFLSVSSVLWCKTSLSEPQSLSTHVCFCLTCAHTHIFSLFVFVTQTHRKTHFPFSACLSLLALFPHCSVYLTHIVIVKPRVQMLRSVSPPFSMWSCEKPHEPSRMHQSCQTPHPHNSSLWTQQQTTQNTLEEHFCWPKPYLAHCSLMVLVELNWGQSIGTAIGVRMGVKSIKVIWQTFYIIAFVTLSAVFSRGLPQISTSGQFGLVCLPIPPCGEEMPMHLWAKVSSKLLCVWFTGVITDIHSCNNLGFLSHLHTITGPIN